MIKAIFYKEWVKTRRLVWLITGVFIFLIVYTFIDSASVLRSSGIVETWHSIIIFDGNIISSLFKWLPLIFGVMFAGMQFLPEMAEKRLKLTLHLPLKEQKIILAMLTYGLLSLLLLFLVTQTILYLGLSFSYPKEIIWASVQRAFPWFLAGMLGYLFGAWILLETNWRQQIFNTLIAIGTLSLLFYKTMSGGYNQFLIGLVLLFLIVLTFPFFSAMRFKEGVQ